MTALTIIGQACARLGITAPTAIFSATDDQTIQLRNLMNEEGDFLAKGASTDHAWTALITEKTFTTTAAAIQTSAVPSDFGWIINETLWNRTLVVRYDGPTSPQDWQKYQAAAITIALPFGVFRFRGGNLLIFPSPTVGQTAAYEYVTKNWAQTSGAVGISAMTADTDTALLDESLVTLGLRWRFLASKGLDYAETFRSYELAVNKAIGRDGGRKTMSLHGALRSRFGTNIPEGNWNQ